MAFFPIPLTVLFHTLSFFSSTLVWFVSWHVISSSHQGKVCVKRYDFTSDSTVGIIVAGRGGEMWRTRARSVICFPWMRTLWILAGLSELVRCRVQRLPTVPWPDRPPTNKPSLFLLNVHSVIQLHISTQICSMCLFSGEKRAVHADKLVKNTIKNFKGRLLCYNIINVWFKTAWKVGVLWSFIMCLLWGCLNRHQILILTCR